MMRLSGLEDRLQIVVAELLQYTKKVSLSCHAVRQGVSEILCKWDKAIIDG